MLHSNAAYAAAICRGLNMSPLNTPKYLLAVAKLQELGLIPAAIALLADKGIDAIYEELSARGVVWSTDLQRWRKSKKPRKVKRHHVRDMPLDGAQIRLVVNEFVSNAAIDQMATALRDMGYDVVGVNLSQGRNKDQTLVYLRVICTGANNG